MNIRRFMSQKLITHFLRTSQHGTIQVYVNDKYDHCEMDCIRQ